MGRHGGVVLDARTEYEVVVGDNLPIVYQQQLLVSASTTDNCTSNAGSRPAADLQRYKWYIGTGPTFKNENYGLTFLEFEGPILFAT